MGVFLTNNQTLTAYSGAYLDILITRTFTQMILRSITVRIVEEHVFGIVLCESKESESLVIFPMTFSAFETQLATSDVHVRFCPTVMIENK